MRSTGRSRPVSVETPRRPPPRPAPGSSTGKVLRNELKARSDQELDNSWREINDAVVAFAREQGYDLIVASPVVYAGPRVDITDKILDRLRRQSAKGATP